MIAYTRSMNELSNRMNEFLWKKKNSHTDTKQKSYREKRNSINLSIVLQKKKILHNLFYWNGVFRSGKSMKLKIVFCQSSEYTQIE